MAISGDVFWHEGLFLRPHHFQLTDRRSRERDESLRRLMRPFPYGVVRARLATDDLLRQRLRFENLHVVMRDGLEVDVPGNADLPVVAFRERFEMSTEPLTVYLAVPYFSDNESAVVHKEADAAGPVRSMFSLREGECNDEQTGDNPQPVQVKRLNARLMFDGDDRDGYNALPILRIAHGAGQYEGEPVVDVSFIPPSLVVTGSDVLIETCRRIANLVEANRQQLAQGDVFERRSAENVRGADMVNFMRYRTLARFGPRVQQLVRVPKLSPFDFYLECLGLVGELGALSAEGAPPVPPESNHDNLAPCFAELESALRFMLRDTVEVPLLRVPFVRSDDGQWAAQLDQEHLERPNAYYLALRSRMDSNRLASLVERGEGFKLIATSLARMSAAIFGVQLRLEHAPPPVLPRETGLYYFKLETAARESVWQRVTDEKAMCIVGHARDLREVSEAVLCMTIPPE